MQYHVEWERDSNYFLLNGAGDPIHVSVLKNQADAGALIEMPYSAFLTSLQDIFIDGGAALVTELMKKDLIDNYTLSVIPVFIGSGIRLFKDSGNELGLELARCSSFPSGLVQLWYNRKR
jgi:dihydrofolate reductase